MRLLVLGGTAFLGRAVARSAVERGWAVTCLARGSAEPPEGVTFIRADRTAPDALDEVAGTAWDAVVDVARQPGQVRAAVAGLTAGHWVFVSSANAYARFDTLEQDERAPLLNPLPRESFSDPTDYGPAKVACERIVREAPATATIVRLGLLTGPGDTSGRVGYYAWRFAHPTGSDVLVPPDRAFPCSFIDVDDLSAWLLHCAEARLDRTFNATGPTVTLSEVLAWSREAAGSTVAVRPIPAEIVAAEGLAPWMGADSLPLWIDDSDWRFFATLDTTAARANGLVTRPYADTLARTLAWQHALGDAPASGLSDERERALRARLNAEHA